MNPTRTRTLIATALLLLLAPAAALADDVYVRSGKEAAELPLKNVTIRNVKDGELYFMINNRESHRPLTEISRLDLTGESQFNAAEKSFADARNAKDETAARPRFSDAVSGYTSTLGSTNKPWLKDYVALRMQVAAPRSGRFDAALAAWKAIVDKDPAAALKAKPSVDGIDPKSAYLANAAKDLATSANAAAKPDVRRAYLDLLGDVQTAMGDTQGAINTAEMKVQLGGTPEEVAELAIKLAQADLANKRYDAAIDRLTKANTAALTDAARAEASFVLAEARAAKLPPTAPPDDLKDIAIEYMKVVSGFPASPAAAPALLKVAEIHETLKDPQTALKVYQQVAREHANTPAAQTAQAALARLGKPQ
jgi:TolA-binding protein